MTASLRLSVPDLAEAAERDAFFGVAAAAEEADGADPFNEQARLDVASGRRSPRLLSGATEAGGVPGAGGTAIVGAAIVGAAIVGAGELDLVIAPSFRGHGFATAALEQLLAGETGPLSAWSHGDHPAARRLAPRFGFAPVRTLLLLAAPVAAAATAAPALPAGFRIEAMRPGTDDAEWVALNARVFAAHPEQGSLTVADLRARQAEPWFDPEDVLLLRDDAGRLAGYDWLKVEDGAGEVYVLGVAPELAGRGLGRALLQAGLARLAERGIREAHLYVEGDNEAAVRLYRSAGFRDRAIDVQYRRPGAS